MSARRFSQFKQRRTRTSGKAPAPGMPGEAPAAALPGERTAAWPSAGRVGPMPFNRATKVPVVKTTARKQGLA